MIGGEAESAGVGAKSANSKTSRAFMNPRPNEGFHIGRFGLILGDFGCEGAKAGTGEGIERFLPICLEASFKPVRSGCQSSACSAQVRATPRCRRPPD